MKIVTILFLGLLFVSLAYAGDESFQKYRNHTPEQIQKLSEKVRHGEMPMAYIMAAEKGVAPGSELLFAMELNALMYPGLHDYQAAVKAFQVDVGDKPTGALTVWQIHTLEKRFEMQKLSSVAFPDDYRSYQTDVIASVQGTMTILDEKIAWPINHVKVTCYKSENYCQLEQISLSVPDDSSWSQTYGVSQHPTELFEISRWTKDSIDANPYEGDNGCRITSLNLNFKTKEFLYITRNGEGDCEVLGTTLNKLVKPRITQIIDGSKIFAQKFAQISKSAFDVLSSDFQKKVDKVISNEAKK